MGWWMYLQFYDHTIFRKTMFFFLAAFFLGKSRRSTKKRRTLSWLSPAEHGGSLPHLWTQSRHQNHPRQAGVNIVSSNMAGANSGVNAMVEGGTSAWSSVLSSAGNIKLTKMMGISNETIKTSFFDKVTNQAFKNIFFLRAIFGGNRKIRKRPQICWRNNCSFKFVKFLTTRWRAQASLFSIWHGMFHWHSHHIQKPFRYIYIFIHIPIELCSKTNHVFLQWNKIPHICWVWTLCDIRKKLKHDILIFMDGSTTRATS